MIIKKKFDHFKKIVQDEQKIILLFKPNSFWKALLFTLCNYCEEPLIDNDTIKISFVSGRYIYRAEFVRDSASNFIKVKNHLLGQYFWYFLNKYITTRIINNWESIN